MAVRNVHPTRIPQVRENRNKLKDQKAIWYIIETGTWSKIGKIGAPEDALLSPLFPKTIPRQAKDAAGTG